MAGGSREGMVRFGSERPVARPEAQGMEASPSQPDRGFKAIDALAMELSKNLPLQFISEFRRAHEEGVNLMALADAVLVALSKRLSECGRCRVQSCGSCTNMPFHRSGPSQRR